MKYNTTLNNLKNEILKQASKELENNVIVDYFDFSDSLLSCFHLSEYNDFIDDNNINIVDLILEVLNDNFNKLYLDTTIYYYSKTRNLYNVEKDIILTLGELETEDFESYLTYRYQIHENLGLREYKNYCEYELIEAIKINIDDIYEKLYDEDLRHHTISIE